MANADAARADSVDLLFTPVDFDHLKEPLRQLPMAADCPRAVVDQRA